MEVILIYPHGGPTPTSPPLGLLHLDAILKENGITSKVLYASNMSGTFQGPKELLTQLASILDQLITKDTVCCGLSVMTGLQIYGALHISNLIKARYPHVKVMWGGVHPTLSPEHVALNENVDLVCKGEFETSMVNVVKSLKRGADPRSLVGVCSSYEGTVYNNSISKERYDLNNLPLVRYKDINTQMFELKGDHPFYKFTTGKVGTIELTRGCPLSCYYCVQNNLRTPFRYMTVENTLKHLRHLKDSGFEAVVVADDNFYISPISKKVLEAVLSEDLQLQFYFSIPVTKIVKMKEHDLSLLEKIGVKSLGISVESGSDRMLRIMGKKHTAEMALEANSILKDYSFVSNYNYIAGYPEETLGDVMATFDNMEKMLKENPRAAVNIKKLIPTPGTDVYHRCVEKGLPEPKDLLDWHKLVDLEWERDWDYVDPEVQSFYRSKKDFIDRVMNAS